MVKSFEGGRTAVMKSRAPGLRGKDCRSFCFVFPKSKHPNPHRILVGLESCRIAFGPKRLCPQIHLGPDHMNPLQRPIGCEGDVAGAKDFPIHARAKTRCVGLVIGHTPAATHYSLCSNWVDRCHSNHDECSKDAEGRRECLHSRGVFTPTVSVLMRYANNSSLN